VDVVEIRPEEISSGGKAASTTWHNKVGGLKHSFHRIISRLTLISGQKAQQGGGRGDSLGVRRASDRWGQEKEKGVKNMKQREGEKYWGGVIGGVQKVGYED